MLAKISLLLWMLFAFIMPSVPGFAQAAAGAPPTQIEETLCNVVKLAQGGIGKAIAAIIIISLAIALFLGKVSWGLAIAVAVGMGLLFGAPAIVNLIAPAGAAGCA